MLVVRLQQPADGRFELAALSASEVARPVLSALEVLYASAYYNSRMFERLLADLVEPPEIFRLFVVLDHQRGEQIVGARVIQSTAHDFFDYQGFAPIHGKRLSVASEHRRHGLGRQLVLASNAYVFDELCEPVVFGESNEIGALAMHCRAGAVLHVESILEHFSRNGPDHALSFFAEFLTNIRLRGLRLPTGQGVRYAYCGNPVTQKTFTDHGYCTLTDILDVSNGNVAAG